MARGLNKVMLIGHVGADPAESVRFTPSGKMYAALSVATSESRKNKDGDWEETTEWHRVVLWERLAEIARDHVKKGALVYVEGKISQRNYTDAKTGETKYITEILGRQLLMLSGKADTPSDAPVNDAPDTAGADDADLPF